MVRALTGIIAFTVLLVLADPAQAAEPIGGVTRIQGRAEAGGRTLFRDAPVFRGDVLRTGPNARLEVTFADETVLTLGERADIAINEMVFDDRPGGALSLASGAFRLITGLALKTNPDGTMVNTPVGTIGIRGTDFWGGGIDAEGFSVLLLGGRIEITNAAGSVRLDEPGLGVTIAVPDAAPPAPTRWSEERRTRAFATVLFE